MFFPEAQVRFWLYTRPMDMRKSFDDLATLVKSLTKLCALVVIGVNECGEKHFPAIENGVR